jgi:glucose-6-phosphate 1-dehydrogenase
MLGNQYLFVSREEIEQAWQWIDAIKLAWEKHDMPLYTYPSGTWGPLEVIRLYNGKAHVWGEQNAVT